MDGNNNCRCQITYMTVQAGGVLYTQLHLLDRVILLLLCTSIIILLGSLYGH
jgi:hypothetical protein